MSFRDFRGSRRGPHSERFQRRASIGSLPDGVTARAHVRSFRPGRGADGCRATAVGGAFGRAYFPDVSANDGISWHRPPPPPPPPPTPRITTTTTTTTTTTKLHVVVRG
ncbi:unnamed protein product [Lasius platythorax]|uniref:Uncharacterized protein n=1 Tax=Lasius platythorax TaxID=488582 RepID=A0AAV2N040_9HYME